MYREVSIIFIIYFLKYLSSYPSVSIEYFLYTIIYVLSFLGYSNRIATSDSSYIRRSEKRACPRSWLFQKLHRPTDTNPQGYKRAEKDMGIFQLLNGWVLFHLTAKNHLLV